MGSDGQRPARSVTEAAWHFDTAGVAVCDRKEFVRDAVSHGIVPVELQDLQEAGAAVDLRLDASDLGPVGLQSMGVTPTVSTRGPRLARDDSPPTVFLELMQASTSTVVQEGREAVVGPGQLVLVSSSQASVVVSPQHSHRRVLAIPVEHLAVPDATLRRALAVTVGRELPLAGVLGRFVEDLPLRPDLPQPQAEHLARAAVDLVRGLVAAVTGDEAPARQAAGETLQLHLVDYLAQHWREHDLTADRLAAAHHISTRQLYRLLAAEGISLGDWLRQRRLEACRDELARPGAAAVSVAAVGRRWGFADATNFGRAFKGTFGLTPLQWRLLHQRR